MYSSNRPKIENRPYKKIFKALFPNEDKIFSLLKKEDYTLLPRLLQRIESKLMLDNIAKRIYREYPDMPLFTIHDSIVCPKGYEEIVGHIMREEIINAIGANPKMEYDLWTPDSLTKQA